MWRILFVHVDEAYSKLDIGDVVWIGADEKTFRKGHDYLMVFADLIEQRVIFATEEKEAETFQRLAIALYAHNGHPKVITQVNIDMSPAYQQGVRENLGNAEILYERYHAVPMVNEAVNKVRKAEALQGEKNFKKELKASRWIFRENPSNLTHSQNQQLQELDLKNLATRIAQLMRLNFQKGYRSRNEVTALKNNIKWIRWVKRNTKKSGDLLDPMDKVANSIEPHL